MNTSNHIAPPSAEYIADFIARALYEDIRDGDHTSLATVPAEARGKARLLVKEEGVLAGIEIAKAVFLHLDPTAEFEVFIQDGSRISYGDVAFVVEAHSRAILMGERLALNTMQRMSGIATLTRQYVDKVADLPVTLLDTRKTTPLLRAIEKYAVRIGGGTNYRDGLYDRIMIKDNHTDFCGSLSQAIDKVHDYLRTHQLNLPITVEVRNMAELDEVLSKSGVERVMFDNFSPAQLREGVAVVSGRLETEASGGITLETLREYAETGVNFISVGALTHSYTGLDLSLKKM